MIGYKAKIYYDATPLADGPLTATWLEVTLVKDATLGDETEDVDDTTRKQLGRKASVYGLRDNTIDFEIKWDTADTAFAALYTAYRTSAFIAVAIMDGDITEGGITGVVGNFEVSKFTRNEPIGGQVTATVALRPNSNMDDYTVVITMDDAVSSIDADGAPLNLTGIGFGATEGEVYVTDHATWGSEAKKNLCVVNTWAAAAIGALANMTGFPGEGETCYAWVVTARGVVSSNSDSFTYTLI